MRVLLEPSDVQRGSMLERAVQILQAFRPHGGTLTLPALVERTGLPKPTVHRLATTLVELGLLERQPLGYQPGLVLFELGELVSAKTDLRECALPYLQDLYTFTGHTVHLAVRDDLDVVYLEKIHGHRGVDVPSRVGGRLPLSSTGIGKALLAYSSPTVIDAVLSRPLRRLTGQSVTTAAQLAEDLDEIRRTGIAYDREEAAVGVSCLATPVLVRGNAVAALSLTMPAAHASPPGLSSSLRTIGAALGRALTGTEVR